MTFFTRQDIGRLYVIRMELPDDTIVHKIGMCKSDRATDRMMEILRSWFVKYRFVPYTELKLDMQTHYPVDLETFIHSALAQRRYIPTEKVSGGTEMFQGLDEFRLIHYLKRFDTEIFKEPVDLTDTDYMHLCDYLAPKV
jgi:hypothetical protein